MKPHTQTYLRFFGYDTSDFIPCEVCDGKAVDIHHIDCRSMGGTQGKDVVTNLMALCRGCHNHYGDKAQHMDFLTNIHAYKVEARVELMHRWLEKKQANG